MTKLKQPRRFEINPTEALEAVQALYNNDGNVAAAARNMGLTRSAMQRRLRKADMWGITAHGELTATHAKPLPRQSGKVTRLILTAAQSNTKAHKGFWNNLRALSKHYDAQIMVSRLRYNHSASQVGQEKTNRSADDTLWYDSCLESFFVDERIELCDGLVWAGDMNIIPTATQPLSGLDSFTGSDSCIFPHPQIALKSIATAPETTTKFNYTTGAVTLKNYIKRKAGLKAEFHHAYGALLAEIDARGNWFVRQINATDDGVIYDLDLKVDSEKITNGNPIEVFTPGDIHGTKLDPVVLKSVWGRGGLLDTLKPRHQVLHDVMNFGSRSHHNNFFDQMKAHYGQAESVEQEVFETAKILNKLTRKTVKTYVVKSNHDEHLDQWVMAADFRRDPVNAHFFLTAATAKVEALKRRDETFDLVAHVLGNAGLDESVKFLSRFECLKIADVRHDQHGDLGPNGARGSAANIARTGEKSNIGHSHSAAIYHGCYQAGTFSILEMGYNRGPSSWSHSLILTYENGKRAIITLQSGKWRA